MAAAKDATQRRNMSGILLTTVALAAVSLVFTLVSNILTPYTESFPSWAPTVAVGLWTLTGLAALLTLIRSVVAVNDGKGGRFALATIMVLLIAAALTAALLTNEVL